MNIETVFDDLNLSVVTGVQLLEALNIDPAELSSPQRFSKLKSVINFFKQFPEDTQRFLINKATRGKNVDKLSHMFEYSQLLQEKGQIEGLLDQTTNEIRVLNGDDQMKVEALSIQLESLKGRLKNTQEEIAIYEK